MHNFRALKNRLINSRRDSQKIQESDIPITLDMNKLPHLTILPELNSMMQSMTPDHYKIIIKNLTKMVDQNKQQRSSKMSDTAPNSSQSDRSLSQRIRLVRERLIRLSCCDEANTHEGCFSDFALADSPSDIKFRRINVSESMQADDTFLTEELAEDRGESIGEESIGEESIEESIEDSDEREEEYSTTLLSKISEVSEESFESCGESFSSQAKKESPEESLEYKKIFYMLQSSGKGSKHCDQANHGEHVWGKKQGVVKNRSKNRSKNRRKPLEDIVNLLQNKYKKKLNFQHVNKIKKPFY